MNKLIEIQKILKAPKNQFNSFGKYKYRSCEDILEAVKPLLAERGLLLTITDDILGVGDRCYVKATATISEISNGEKSISVSACAREQETKKGMDSAQITGAASSYARKYALNGLFLIDDTKDSDATNGSREEKEEKISEKELVTLGEWINATETEEDKFCKWLKIESLIDLPKSDYKMALEALKRKLKK